MREKWQSRPWRSDELTAPAHDVGFEEEEAERDQVPAPGGADESAAAKCCRVADGRLRSAGRRLLRQVLFVADYMLGPSSSSRHCRQVFRSLRSIQAEQNRQRRLNRFIIHPFSRFRFDAIRLQPL
jgi:hypothetical protein